MDLRAIINIDIGMTQRGDAALMEKVSSPGGLFRAVAGVPGQGEWERWSRALVLTVLVHAGALFVGLVAHREQPKVARPEEPELVLLTFVPARAAAPRAVSVSPPPEPVQRKARARVHRPFAMPLLPVPIPEKPPVPEEAAQDEQEPAPDEQAEAATGSEAVMGVVAGLVDSAMTTRGTAGLGVPGGEAVDLKQVLRPPEVLEQVQPQYPRQARSLGVEGLVLVRVIVGIDGRIEPEHTRVVRSVPALDTAAVAAVSRWRFSPAIGRHGRVVRVILEVPFQFSLR